MKTILLVDDDPLVQELYRRKLTAGGYAVQTATDGVQAIKQLESSTPDFIVLDLMMPKLSGAEVLKYIRSKPALAQVPVAALTNSFMSDQARTVSSLGVERAIVKGDCTPAKMLAIVNEVLLGSPTASPVAAPAPASPPDSLTDTLINRVPATFTDLLAMSAEFARDPAAASRSGTLHVFCRQTHLLTNAAAGARCHHLTLLSGALEALLFDLSEKPVFVTTSTSRTVTSAVELLGVLVEKARLEQRQEPIVGEVLAVDDDPLANRIALAALSRAKLTARAVERPEAALELAAKIRFDLFLLDVEMPGMDGFALCRQIRKLPGYEHTPVIYVTSHADFDNRSRSQEVGAQDLIAKPILPIELAVKAVLNLIKGKLRSSPTPVTSPA
jgi:CheY-like chemotaxis protein